MARGRPHGRSAGVEWLYGALQDAVAQSLWHDASPTTVAVADGVEALLALGLLLPYEPLVEQVALLGTYPDGAGDLDPSFSSPLGGRDRRPADRDVAVALARVVDLGDRAARLDVVTIDERGLRLSGWFSPWGAGRRPGDTGGWRITGFDDRHNQYVTTVGTGHPNPAGADVTWQLWPALDPRARSLRLRLTGPTQEASVEVVVE